MAAPLYTFTNNVQVPVSFSTQVSLGRFLLGLDTYSVNTQITGLKTSASTNPIIITIITTLYCHHNNIMGSIMSLEF